MRWLTATQYAKKHGVTLRAVNYHLCRLRIEGAVKCRIAGRVMWAIPADAPYPDKVQDITEDYDITAAVEKELERRNKKR